MNYSFETALNKSDRGGWVRLLTLTYLRWIAIIGQTFAVVNINRQITLLHPVLI